MPEATSRISEGQHPQDETGKFTVVGSGVIGLLTAHELAGRGHEVTIISKEGQPNLNTSSTSSIAIGQFLPWIPSDHLDSMMGGIDPELSTIVDQSRQYYEVLANNPHHTGVMRVRNIELVNERLEWPHSLAEAMHTEKQALDKPVSIVAADGESSTLTDEYVFESFSINTGKTMSYLAEAAKERGINFVVAKLNQGDLETLDGIVINVTGMGAKELTGDTEIQHYKGHTMILRPHVGRDQLEEALSVEDLIIIPREDGTIVAGALYLDDPKNPIPERGEAEELLSRLGLLARSAGSLVQGLDAKLFEESDILQHSAGYRVVMESGGIKVMTDKKLTRVLHAYGFAGIGWSVGPAFAERIANQALDMHNKRNKGE